LRGIAKPLHSFNVHLRLYIRCLNGSLGPLSFHPFRGYLGKPSAVFDFRLLAFQSKGQLHPVDSSFHRSSLAQSDGHYGDIIVIITTRSFSRASSSSPLQAPLPQPPPLATSAKPAPRLQRTFLVHPKQFRRHEVCDYRDMAPSPPRLRVLSGKQLNDRQD
jgi:hypothetical protein